MEALLYLGSRTTHHVRMVVDDAQPEPRDDARMVLADSQPNYAMTLTWPSMTH